jgi:hypothetical protein
VQRIVGDEHVLVGGDDIGDVGVLAKYRPERLRV